jgi:PAS domain S-box-containing protein
MLRLIHVDDSPEEIFLTRMHLKPLLGEHNIKEFTLAEDALEALEDGEPCDVIISDYQMPIMDGMQFLKAVRKRWPDLPFIFLTGQGNEEIAVEAFRNGADEYYTKEESFAHYERFANSIKNLHKSSLEKREYIKAQLALAENESLLKSILEASPVGIGLVKDRRVVWGSSPIYEMLGYSQQEMDNRDPRFLYFDDEEYMRVGNKIDADLKEHGYCTIESKMRRKDGALIHVLNKSRLIDLDHPEKGYIVALTDITEKKLIEEQIRLQADLLQSVEQAVIATDNNGIINYFNPYAEKLYGWKKEEVLGKPIYQVTVPEEQLESASKIMAELTKGNSWSGEYKVRKKDGTLFDIAITNSPYFDSTGQLAGVIGVSSDITEKKKAGERLRQSEEAFRSIFENSPVGIFRTTSTGKPLSVNPEMARMLGAESVGEALAHYSDLVKELYVYPEQREEFIRLLEEKGFVRDFEYLAHKSDGSVAWISMNARIAEKRSDDSFIIDGFAVDITSQKNAEQSRQESYQRFRNILENAALIGLSLDRNGHIVFINDYLLELSGWQLDEVKGKSWFDLFIPENARETVKTFFAETMELEFLPEEHTHYDNDIITRAGEHHTVSWTNILDRDAEGNVIGVSSVGINITEKMHFQRQLEEAYDSLSLSETKYRAYMESSPVAIFVADENGNYSDVNRAACDMTGYSKSELMQKRIPEVDQTGDETEAIDTLRTLDKDGVFRSERKLRKKDGSFVSVDLHAVKITNYRYMAFCMDISESSKRKQQLEDAQDRLKSMNEELKAFTYSVSHDLKAPVRQALGFFELLDKEELAKLHDEEKNKLQLIRKTIGRMDEMLKEYLRLSRTMNKEIELVKVDFSALAKSIFEELQTSQPDRKVAMMIEPDLSVQTDQVLLTSVLSNIIGNAWKYTSNTDNAEIEIGKLEDARKEVFFVKDNGIGFDMSKKTMLFIPFQRLHNQEEYSGTGIGLSIAQRAVNRLGGRIWAKGAPGKGATLFFTLGDSTGE